MRPLGAPTTPATRVEAGRDDDGAWRERSARLYLELEPLARAMVRRGFQGAFGEDDLDDLYSNAWVGTLRALEPRHAELSDEEIRSYVLTAVAHQASRELRRRRRKPTHPLDAVASAPDPTMTPEETAAESEQSRITRDLLVSLPPRRRAVMLLRCGWGLEPSQVCNLIGGLSPRAYRKEVTRGVDELIEKLRSHERGEWCSEREPVLKAYASGLGDADTERQAQAHLAHCRDCSDFVAKLSGHLHDLGGALAGPIALDGVDGHAGVVARVAEAGERARDVIAGAFGRSGSGAEELAAAASTSGVGRGAGAAGIGAIAKLTALGGAGKAAVACIGGGVAATACLAAGVAPLGLGPREGPDSRPNTEASAAASPEEPPVSLPQVLPSQVDVAPPASPEPAAGAPPPAQPDPQTVEEEPPAPTGPVAPSAPPAEQEFGVIAGASSVPTTGSSGGSSGGTTSSSGTAGGGAPVRQEFGP